MFKESNVKNKKRIKCPLTIIIVLIVNFYLAFKSTELKLTALFTMGSLEDCVYHIYPHLPPIPKPMTAP